MSELEWIPIATTPPPTDKCVLVWYDTGYKEAPEWFRMSYWVKDRGRVWTPRDEHASYDTHWCVIPAPVKEMSEMILTAFTCQGCDQACWGFARQTFCESCITSSLRRPVRSPEQGVEETSDE